MIQSFNRLALSPHRTQPQFQGSPSGYGATYRGQQTDFKLSAPTAEAADLLILSPRKDAAASPQEPWYQKTLPEKLEKRVQHAIPMKRDSQGNFKLTVGPLGPGALYMYRLHYQGGNQSQPLPDPYSEAQPEDVNGPSQVVNERAFQWKDQQWHTPSDTRQMNIYRLHVGTWTREGTLKGAKQQLRHLKSLGFNTVELFPTSEFPGRQNWGYDPANFYAVENAYGKPDDLKQFVNEAHRLGVAVLLDGVFNHVSGEGQYFTWFDQFFLKHNATPWGDGFNWDNPKARQYALDNVQFWLEKFHVDGFRLDSTPEIPDEALRAIIHIAKKTNENAIIIAENAKTRNSTTAKPSETVEDNDGEWRQGFNANAQWNFSYHHDLQSLMTGQNYKNAVNTPSDWVDAIWQGFHRNNKISRTHLNQAVHYDQSHDEIANDNKGQRNVALLGGTPEAARKAMMASAVKYLLPGIPLNLMGQEYAERNPFLFFSDHADESSRRSVIESRPEGIKAVNGEAFQASKLKVRHMDPRYLRLTQDMLRLRQDLPALWQGDRPEMDLRVHPVAPGVVQLQRFGKENPEDSVFVLINFSDQRYTAKNALPTIFPMGTWQEVLNTDAKQYGGTNLTNHQAFSEQGPVKLAPWSFTIFRNQEVPLSQKPALLFANNA